MTNLKPCPNVLCGSQRIRCVSSSDGFYVICDWCGCAGTLCYSREESNKDWNTRPETLERAALREAYKVMNDLYDEIIRYRIPILEDLNNEYLSIKVKAKEALGDDQTD